MSREVDLLSESETPLRLDVFIASSDIQLSRSAVKKLIESKMVKVNNEVIHKAGHLIVSGDKVSITIPSPKKIDLEAKDVGIEILFEDNHLAILNKPSGISVHPSHTENAPTVVHGLLHSLKSLSSVGGIERPGIVHRIDKGTSGILVISKTDEAHHALSKLFKAHDIERVYIALVWGDLLKRKGKSGRIESFYGRHPVNRKKMTGKKTDGRKAITNWSCLKSFHGEASLVECRLETGRTHQIRVHMAELGFPIVGDPLYGEDKKYIKNISKKKPALAGLIENLGHQLLHAKKLGFVHPVTGKKMDFEKSIPTDFEQVLELLQK